MKKTILSAIFVLCFLIPIIEAAPIYNPGTGHYYERVNVFIEWPDAKTAAEQSVYLGIPGHLATITTPEEDQWIQNNLGGTVIENGDEIPFEHFIGGYQEVDASHPAEGWHWVTGEPWDFTNWWSDEPNDGKSGLPWPSEDGDQNALAYNRYAWSDTEYDNHWLGYVVEYDPAYIPIPGAVWLLGSGLIALVGLRKRLKR